MQYLTIFTLALSIAIASSALTSQDLMNIQMTLRNCNRQNNVDSSIINQALSGQVVNNRQFDCFVACLLQGIGVSSADGSLNVEAAVDKVPDFIPNRDSVINAIRSCGTRRGSDQCDTAHMLYMCMHENNVPSMLMGR